MKAAAAWMAWVLAIVACPVLGAEEGRAGDPTASKTLSPYFFVEDGDPAVDRIPLESTRVDAVISGVIANVRVTQVYVNRGSRPIHAKYVFPGSTRAAVHGMTMTVGDQRVVARIQERAEAKATFEKAVREGKSASLLEQSRPNVFSMRVGNILPGDRVEVELRYTELLTPEERVYEFVFPTVVGPRYSSQRAQDAPERDRYVVSPYLPEGTPAVSRFDIRVALDAGMPLFGLVCPSHETRTDWGGPAKAAVVLDPKESAGGNRDFILRYRLAGERIASGLVLFQGEEESFFLLMAQPPERVAAGDLPPREFIFVVDVSGSMDGFPLDTSKALLRDLIGRLAPADTFNVLLFAGTSHLMAPRSVAATAENVAAAVRAIEQARGGGGTELYAAMDRALQLPRAEGVARSIVVVTDGYISAEADVFDLIGASLGKTNVFAFGIGSGVNRHLVEGVARAGRGEPFVVTDPGEAASVAARFRRYIESPVLTNISIAAEGFEAYDLEPAGFPDLLAERPLVALGKWRGQAAGRIVIRGTGGQGPWEQTLDVGASAPSPANEALRQLWARARAAALGDFGLEGSAEKNRDAIVALGLKYTLLTPFTSFVAVHEVVRNPGGDGDNVAQPLPLPAGVSNSAVGMTQGSEPELAFVLLALLSAMALRRRRRAADAGAPR
jgi:Ca-activated chloride channel family protein